MTTRHIDQWKGLDGAAAWRLPVMPPDPRPLVDPPLAPLLSGDAWWEKFDELRAHVAPEALDAAHDFSYHPIAYDGAKVAAALTAAHWPGDL